MNEEVRLANFYKNFIMNSMDTPKCSKCGMETEGYKCEMCGAESAHHDDNHGCGSEHCVAKCNGCGQAGTVEKCTC